MAAVGLLPFARTALEVATAVLPPYRSRFSNPPFTPPPLLAVRCRMRYEDGTFRETAVRLPEHRAGRRGLQLPSVPDDTTLYRFRKRLDEQTIDPALDLAAPYQARDGGLPTFYGYNDERGRLTMIINHNNDVGDFWEWIDQPRYPLEPSTEALRLGINYFIFAMTH